MLKSWPNPEWKGKAAQNFLCVPGCWNNTTAALDKLAWPSLRHCFCYIPYCWSQGTILQLSVRVVLVLMCPSIPNLALLLELLCGAGMPSRASPGQLVAEEAGAEGGFQGNQKQAGKSWWGKSAISSTLERKSRSPGNLQLLPLPHTLCCVPASCTAEDRSMSFSMPYLSSMCVPSHTSVSRLPAPCKLHSPHIPSARDTPLLPLAVQSTACCRAPGETQCRLTGAVLFSRWASPHALHWSFRSWLHVLFHVTFVHWPDRVSEGTFPEALWKTHILPNSIPKVTPPRHCSVCFCYLRKARWLLLYESYQC